MTRRLFPVHVYLVVATVISEASGQCVFDNFCPSGVTQPDFVVEEAGGFNCGSIATAVSLEFIPDEQCDRLIFAEQFCCPAQEGEPTCFLCGSADITFSGEKYFDGQTCDEMNQKLQLNPREKSCAAWRDIYTTKSNANAQSFCECGNGAEAMNSCNVCGNREVNATAVAPGENMTCGELMEYSKHVVSPDRCSRISRDEIINACCSGTAASLFIMIGLVTTIVFGLGATATCI